MSVTLNKDELKKWDDWHKKAYGEEISFIPGTYIVGCIDYGSTFGVSHHQTGFIVDVRRVDPAHPNISLAINRAEGNLRSEQLRLGYFPIGSGCTD